MGWCFRFREPRSRSEAVWQNPGFAGFFENETKKQIASQQEELRNLSEIDKRMQGQESQGQREQTTSQQEEIRKLSESPLSTWSLDSGCEGDTNAQQLESEHVHYIAPEHVHYIEA